MTSYAKVFSSILDSSVWEESMEVRLVWVTLLVKADQYGTVRMSVPGLSRAARVPSDAVQGALTAFMSPDPMSTSPEHDGRRIEALDGGGWRILNHDRYRRMTTAEDRREKDAERQARARSKAREAKAVTPVTLVAKVTPSEYLRVDQHSVEQNKVEKASAVPTGSQREIDAYDLVTGKSDRRGRQ